MKICLSNTSNLDFWKMPNPLIEELTKSLPRHEFVVCDDVTLLRKQIEQCDAVVGMPFSKRLIKDKSRIKYTHFFTSQIPVSWQNEQLIKVSSSKGVNADSVCDHAMFFTYKAIRGEVGHASFKEDGFLIAQNAKDLNAGVVGFGEVGKMLTNRLSNIFKSVSVCSRTKHSDDYPFFSTSQIQEFLNELDYVYLCLPLSPEAVELFSDNFFSALKKDVTLINLARGELFDESRLVHFFANNISARYLTDVTMPEPYPADGPLNKHSNVFITNHIAGRRADIWRLILDRTKSVIESWE